MTQSPRSLVAETWDSIAIGTSIGGSTVGHDRGSGVLDRERRVHELGILHVVDASLIRSSCGTSPSLTVAANAIRIGEAIDGALRDSPLNDWQPAFSMSATPTPLLPARDDSHGIS